MRDYGFPRLAVTAALQRPRTQIELVGTTAVLEGIRGDFDIDRGAKVYADPGIIFIAVS